MSTHGVACLRCGILRIVRSGHHDRLEPGECPACGYVGWATAAEIAGRDRRRAPADARDRVHLHLVSAPYR